MPWSEFLEWLAYLELEEERAGKMEYYLAQIAAEVRRGYVTGTVKLEDMILNFEKPISPYEKMLNSKKAWGMALGLDLEGK